MKIKNVLGVVITLMMVGGVPGVLGQQASEAIKLAQYPVKPDKEFGASIARIGEGRLHQLDATLVEIPPGGQLAPHRHLAEEIMYIVAGKGQTLMWNREGGKKELYEWKAGDLLSPSLNAWHQHVNTSDTPARYISFTTSPVALNLFHDPAFLSSSEFIFEDRWQQGITQKPEYTPEGGFESSTVVRMRVGHLLPDIVGRELRQRRKGAWGITITPEGDLAGNHLLEMEVREKKAGEFTDDEAHMHRHPWEVAYVVLDGAGYSNLQREGEPKRVLNWQKGDMYIVEANEFHDNRPKDSATTRYLQVKVSGYFHGVGNVGQTIELIDE
jgi:quercetin dioxygenase-like cupin family protein